VTAINVGICARLDHQVTNPTPFGHRAHGDCVTVNPAITSLEPEPDGGRNGGQVLTINGSGLPGQGMRSNDDSATLASRRRFRSQIRVREQRQCWALTAGPRRYGGPGVPVVHPNGLASRREPTGAGPPLLIASA